MFIVNKFHLIILCDELSKIRMLSRKLQINFYANLNIKVECWAYSRWFYSFRKSIFPRQITWFECYFLDIRQLRVYIAHH